MIILDYRRLKISSKRIKSLIDPFSITLGERQESTISKFVSLDDNNTPINGAFQDELNLSIFVLFHSCKRSFRSGVLPTKTSVENLTS